MGVSTCQFLSGPIAYLSRMYVQISPMSLAFELRVEKVLQLVEVTKLQPRPKSSVPMAIDGAHLRLRVGVELAGCTLDMRILAHLLVSGLLLVRDLTMSGQSELFDFVANVVPYHFGYFLVCSQVVRGEVAGPLQPG